MGRQLNLGSGGAMTRRDLMRAAMLGAVSVPALSLLEACTSATPAPAATPTRPLQTTITIGQAVGVGGFDPHVNQIVEEHAIMNIVFDTLVGRDPKTMQPVPRLATSWTTPNDTTWEFKLRSGVKFHNGEPFDASVVKYNIDRINDPATKSFQKLEFTNGINSVEVVDPTTVRFITKQPEALMLHRLQAIYLAPPQYMKEKGAAAATNPVGTGPYRFAAFETGNKITMERNDEYFGPKPAFKTAVFRTLVEPATALAELLSGGVDIIDGVPSDDIDRINTSGVAKVFSSPSPSVLWIRLDALGRGGDTPIADVRVRRAAALAVNREEILKSLQGGRGQVVGTQVSSVFFGYDPSVTPYPFDPAAARTLLREANYPAGRELTFTHFSLSGFLNSKQLAESVATSLAAVGMKTSIRSVASAAVGALRTTGKIGDFSLGISGRPLFDAVSGFINHRKGSANSYYYSDELENTLVAAEHTLNVQERTRLLTRAQQIYKDQVAGIPIFQLPIVVAVSNKVELNLRPDWPYNGVTEARQAP